MCGTSPPRKVHQMTVREEPDKKRCKCMRCAFTLENATLMTCIGQPRAIYGHFPTLSIISPCNCDNQSFNLIQRYLLLTWYIGCLVTLLRVYPSLQFIILSLIWVSVGPAMIMSMKLQKGSYDFPIDKNPRYVKLHFNVADINDIYLFHLASIQDYRIFYIPFRIISLKQN
jgi:hypothetical protein